MSVLYGTSFFQYPDVELRKNKDLVDSNPHSYYDNQNQNSFGLMRYRSAPSSFFDTLVNGSNVGGDVTGGTESEEQYRFFGSSSPKIDTILERFMSSSGDDGSGGSNPHDVQEFEGDRPAAAIKHELTEPSLVFQRNFEMENLSSINDGSSLDRPFVQATKIGSGNGSNLARQSSSTPGFFSNLGLENGFSVIRDSGNYSSYNGTNHEASPRPSRLSNQLSFSSGPWFLPQFSKTADENGGATAENLLRFQSCFPCKIRAKRGCATHPRSIAERVRRTRISERIRKLQDLFPTMDKQTNTADMLELAIEYIKDLQSQVKALSDTKATCKCSSTHNSYSRASA